MGRLVRFVLLTAALGLGLSEGAVASERAPTGDVRTSPAQPRPPRDLEALNTQVRLLMEHSDPLAAEIVASWVVRGLPPSALVTFLEGARRHPRASLVPALRYLMTYRRATIRGRAMVAMVAVGGMDAHRALLAGLDDMDPRVRRLAYELAKVHGNPAVEEAVFRLIEKDPTLAEDGHGIQPAPRQAEPAERDVLVVEDDE